MRKISELSGDEFFDVIYALSPVLPMIADMEIVQTQLPGRHNEKMSVARADIAVNTKLLESGGNAGKKEEYERKIEEAKRIINAEITAIFARDISKIVPLLTSKANRVCVFETLSIIEGLPIDDIKAYPAPKLIAKIREVAKDADFKSFLDYAEESE